MAIRNMEHYAEAFWDWGILEGCFGTTKIGPTDIDGCIERHGWKLVIETKMPWGNVPVGQERFLQSFLDDGHSVCLVWGKDSTPQRIRVMTPTKTVDFPEADRETLRNIVSHWYSVANSRPQKNDPREAARTIYANRGLAYVEQMRREWDKIAMEANALNN